METFLDLKMPLDQRLKLYSRSFGSGEDLVTIVAGIHGDELDGLYICYRLMQQLTALTPNRFGGIVKLIPAANPMGLDVSTRAWPASKIDINRSFPGRPDGRPTDRIAHAIFTEAKKSRHCIDIHSSNIFLQEIPQVRLGEEYSAASAPMAGALGVEVVWVHPSPTVIEATLAWNLSSIGIPTYVIETGIGLRIMQQDCRRIIRGIMSFLHTTGVLTGPPAEPLTAPRLADSGNVEYVNAEMSGIFIPDIAIGSDVLTGTVIGQILDPVTGRYRTITAPVTGYLFTLRAHPIVYVGSLVARIIRCEPGGGVRRLLIEDAAETAA